MADDLKAAIIKALKGSSSQRPVDVSRLYKLGDEANVQAALLEMYHASQVCCCLIIRRGVETTVWWLGGAGQIAGISYRNLPPKAEAAPKQVTPKSAKRVVRRMCPLSIEVKDLICAQPGLTMPEVCEKLNKQAAEYHRIRIAVYSLVKLDHIRAEGVKRHYRYFPGEQA